MRWLCSLLLWIAFSASAEVRDIGFAWDPSPNYSPGLTYEIEANGASATGVTSTTQRLLVPLDAGRVVNARVKAVAPVGSTCGDPPAPCEDSPWAAITQVYPALQLAPDRAAWVVGSGGGGVMAAPTFVAQYATSFNSSGSSKTAMSSVAINSGDVLVLVSATENASPTLGETENGAGSFTNQRSVSIDYYSPVRASTYIAPSSETITVAVTQSGETLNFFGGNVVRFSGADGIGNSASSSGSSGNPSVNITTTQANSAIVVIVGDWNATSGTQTFSSSGGAGAPTNLTGYPGDSARYGAAIAYYPDAGTAGAKTVGMTAPTGQKWTIAAVEVLGTTGGGAIDLAGAAQAQATVTGAVAMTIPTAGTAAAVATTTGSLVSALPVQASASVTATASGDLLLEMALGGGALAAALAIGALGLTMPLSGSASGTATASGTLGLGAEIDLSGDAAGEASATGTLDSTTALAGAATAQAAGSGGVTLTTVLAGSALAEALATAGITLETALAAQAAAQASATGDVVSLAEGALAGDAAAQATATGDIKMATPLDGAAAAQASATGAVGMTVPLAGDAQAQATATGALDSLVDGSLAGDAAAKALATGAVDLSTFVAGPAQVVVTAGGMLGVSVPMAGSATVVVMATGNLQVSLGMPLSAAALAAASADGSLLMSIPLSGAALANAVAQGTLSGGVEAFIPSIARTWAPGYIPRIWHPTSPNRTWIGMAGNRIWR